MLVAEAYRGRLALESAWPHLDTAMTDRATKNACGLGGAADLRAESVGRQVHVGRLRPGRAGSKAARAIDSVVCVGQRVRSSRCRSRAGGRRGTACGVGSRWT